MANYVITANNISELGGAQKIAHTLARGFAQRGHQVHLIGITPVNDSHDYHVCGSYQVHTLMREVWPLKGDVREGSRSTLRARAVAELNQLLASLGSANIIATQLWSLEILLDALPHARHPFPVIGQYHGSFAAAASGRDIKRIQKLAPACEYFAALSAEDCGALLDAGLTNAIAQPNPVSLTAERFAAVRGIKRGATVDFVGRLSPEKGPDLLLEAWELAQLPNPWRLRFTGNGPMLGVSTDRIEYLPPVSDVVPTIAGARVVAIPSRTEGAPLVLAEALALGTPVVVTDVSSGVREMVANNPLAVLVERENPAALASGIERAVTITPNNPTALPDDTAIFSRWESLFAGDY